jgi:hypothetical protein
VIAPSAQVDDRFFSQIECWRASPQRVLGSPEWWSIAQMRSRRRRLSNSVILLCCGVSWVVSCCSIPCSQRNALRLLLMYLPPWSERKRCIVALCCMRAHAANSL